MSKQIKEFFGFIKSHGVVGLAVGLAIGTQVGKAVEAIVVNLINPLVGFIIGNTQELELRTATITAGSREMVIGWGAITSALITLLAVSAVIFWIVRSFKLHKQEKSK